MTNIIGMLVEDGGWEARWSKGIVGYSECRSKQKKRSKWGDAKWATASGRGGTVEEDVRGNAKP